MRNKLDQARDLLRRVQSRNAAWRDTVRNMALLLSEQREAVMERDGMAARPLGFVHGVLERIRHECGADTTLSAELDGRKMLILIKTPKGVIKMEMSEQDYEHNADMLARDVATVCVKRGVI